MKRDELKVLTRRELYEIAKAYELSGRSRLSKKELIENLARLSAEEAERKARPSKRRMSKRRRRRAVSAAPEKSAVQAPSSPSRPAPQPPQPPQPYIDRGPELQQAYGQDKLQAMVRDPNWIYAYWDLSGGARERLSREVEGNAWVLRVHSVSDGGYEDLPVLVDGGNWYIPVASDTEYRLEIGVVDPSGRFHVAASSATVRTPRMGISQVVDEEWMVLEEEFRRLMDLVGSAGQISGSRMLSEVVRGRHRLAGMHSGAVSSIGWSRRK